MRFNSNMHRYLLYFLIFGCLLPFFSCNKDKFKAPAAAYIVVDPVTLKTNFTTQGSNSQKITDIWYYVGGQFKGVYPVGSIMPVVASGKTEIKLFAGIKNNGISATRLPYPFYNSITLNKDIEPGKTYTVTTEFQYNAGVFFYYHDDFDSGAGAGSYFTSAGDSSYVITYDPSRTFGGIGGSVFMSMSNAKPTSRMVQTSAFFLPSDGSTIYLELNYRCNQPFNVGIIGGGFDERTALTVNTSEEWNKIYVQLTKVVSTPPVYAGYKVFIHAEKKVVSPQIYIDNVKLIYQ